MASMNSAPVYDITPKSVVAVEHPMIVRNIDNGLKTFGNGPAFSRIVRAESIEGCVPLYLRHNDIMSTPILSRNIPTNNVLLKITVPKRTGRKRKRGSDSPFSGDSTVGHEQDSRFANSHILGSRARKDDPAKLLRSLKDSAGNYKVEAVAAIEQTHRFRGLADFHHSTSHTHFMPKLRDVMSSANAASVKQFKFDPSVGWKKNEEIMPPPAFAIQAIPTNWCWLQHTHASENIDRADRFKPDKFQLDYIPGDAESLPDSCPYELPSDPDVQSFVAELKLVFDERPIWTRRALINRINNHRHYDTLLLKTSLKYVCYQFRSGPFRDCLVKYGIDPRGDQKYSIYQSIYFRALDEQDHSARADSPQEQQGSDNPRSHIFDGKTLSLDGKTWQLCDVTDPLLVNIIQNAPMRESFDAYNGYFHNGTWAKIRSIMKIKSHGMLYNIPITDEHLEITMKVPDIVEKVKVGKMLHIPLPDFKLTDEEIAERLADGEQEAGIRSRVNPGKRRVRSERAGRLQKKFPKTKGKHGRPQPPTKLAKKDIPPNEELTKENPSTRTIKNGQTETRESSDVIDPQLINLVDGETIIEDVPRSPEKDEGDISEMDATNLEDYEDDLDQEDDWGSEGSEELGDGEGDGDQIDDDDASDGTDVVGFIQQYTADDEWT